MREGRENEKTHFSLLLSLAEHDNAAAVVFPDHPPHVTHCPYQRSLGGYVGPSLFVPLHERERERERVGVSYCIISHCKIHTLQKLKGWPSFEMHE